MKSTKFFLLIFCLACAIKGFSTQYSPWFPPPFEFQGSLSYAYEKVNAIHSPSGNFRAPSDQSSLQLSLDVTPWPYWNTEIELYFSRTSEIPFTYEAAFFTLRYAWLDESADRCSFSSGITLSLPNKKFLHALSYHYHGNINAEFHATLGKEFSMGEEWIFRCWSLGGVGIANRGSPWVHGIAAVEWKPFTCLESGFFSEAIYGLGSKNLLPHASFNGYGSIAHQSVDIGFFTSSAICYLGSVSICAWYNIHAHNFIAHYWGACISVHIPFSIHNDSLLISLLSFIY